MIAWRLCAGLGLAILLVFISACDIGQIDFVLPTGPSLRPSEFRATGFVEDDGCLLPPPAPNCRRLSGVTVEAIGWNRRTTTDAVGRFDLGSLPSNGVGNVHALRGSLPGWTTATGYIGMESIDGVSIRMGQEPHVLFGWVNLDDGFPRPPASNARVEIVDGPNAGKVTMTDSEGRFVFDDLITSPEFRVEASKSGYASVTVVQSAGLSRNGYVLGLYLKRNRLTQGNLRSDSSRDEPPLEGLKSSESWGGTALTIEHSLRPTSRAPDVVTWAAPSRQSRRRCPEVRETERDDRVRTRSVGRA